MKYSVDRIENDIAVLEDVTTKEKIELNINYLPKKIKEGTILEKKDDSFIIDEEEENVRRKRIVEKFNKLKK